ncbi:MAG: class I SAM-dependent methyltransferase [Halanaerobiales bacterium]|nr:class I SAM-dependent methyltransferase [Halanaerobiales bacterium]
MHNSLQFSHKLIKSKVQPGDLVIDATAGNGLDTLLLAQLVGKKGKVYSYDVQASALEQTRNKLEKADLLDQVRLIHRGHETIDQDLVFDQYVRAAMFNLGYLPSGDHSIITKSKTTLKALKILTKHLLPRGIITIVAYHGHTGGREELNHLSQFITNLDQHHFEVLQYQFINQINEPPILFVIEKRYHKGTITK